jgi:hypothetical protein
MRVPAGTPSRSYNVHPIAHSLERFSNRRMMMVIRRAVSGWQARPAWKNWAWLTARQNFVPLLLLP